VEKSGALRIRTYWTSGPLVVVLHGGPAAVGEAAPVARGLADAFRVLEPWQRGSGGEPLTVARHVADLDDLVAARSAGARPALVGESWGAMLALAYAAAHPGRAGPLVLIGCGTFDPAARARLRATLEERTDGGLRRRLERLQEEVPDPGERLRQRHTLMESLYSYDPVPPDAPEQTQPFDLRAHTQTWADMVRLQEEGVYPAAFAAIRSPVLMLHGAYDPHPGRLIRASLAPYLPQLEYRQWDRCGHSPWLERAVRDEFFAVLRQWLARHLPDEAPGSSHAV
jgi:pimeloyl-ACP methyl ester carboxylesterase